jgi:GDP-L-fucose synthase
MRIYVAGINGMVGSAFAEVARSQSHEVLGKSSSELDLTDRKKVFRELVDSSPDVLLIAAAKVGGIGANASQPVDFLSVNLQLQTNLIDGAYSAGVEKVIFLGSSCIYPKFAPQPIHESALLSGELEPTNEAYAIAKIAGIKLISAYQQQYGLNWYSVMPTNLYGPRDNFDLYTAHVLPSLLHRFHIGKIEGARSVEIWGDGTPCREFLHVNDLGNAIMTLLNKYESSSSINIGSGNEISIGDLAILISKTVGFEGDIHFNTKKPNGTPRKFLESTRIRDLGWRPQINLEQGISDTYDWFLKNENKVLNK